MKKIAINGFGRIGRHVFRTLVNEDVEVVAINDLTSPATLAHLLKYDSAQGAFEGTVEHTQDSLIVNGKSIKVFAERDPESLPWGELNIDLVVESTGFFVTEEGSQKHINAGAKKVLISAPAKGNVKMVVYNVNHEVLTAEDKIASAASCTTNCLAPVVKTLDEAFGLQSGLMTTIHGYTGDQRMVDAPHGDLRRARAGAVNIIPTTTGAAAAIGKVIPAMAGKLNGNAMRVPTITGSVVDFTFKLSKDASIEDINKAVKAASNETLGFTMDPIVSTDVIGTTHGSLFDGLSTDKLLEGEEALYKIVTWYDNEMSYVNQYVRTLKHFLSL